MKVLIDACVLVPRLTRALVMEAVRVERMTPIWSPKILAEWQSAVAKLGPVEAAENETEIALLRARYPGSEVEVAPEKITGLYLPDPDDRHVLAAAITAGCHALLTFNTKDFPIRTLGDYGIIRRHPDEFLLETAQTAGDVFQKLISEAAQSSGRTERAVLKSSHLPRLAKFLSA